MYIDIEYEQYSIEVYIQCTELDGSDLGWSIISVFDNDKLTTVDFNSLDEQTKANIDKKSEDKASYKACDAAADYWACRADFYKD